MRKITLSSIADAMGVSTATVSLALRDSPLVAERTRDKIKDAARDMGYIYNRRAASLRTSRSGIIGVVVHDIMNPFFAEILMAIENELGLNRKTFLLCNHHDKIEIQNNFIETLLQFGADGVILSPAIGTTAENISSIEANGLPVVMIARHVDGVDTPVFRGDDKAGIAMATNHLIDLGHRDIAFIGGMRETSTGRDRRAGYLSALAENAIPENKALQMGSLTTRKAGYESVIEMIQSGVKPTAIVCFNDLVAIGVINGLRSLGIAPGKDIAITGYDNIAEAEISSPPLTSVWNGQQSVGQQAAQAMVAAITGGSQPRERVPLIEPKLIIRETSCPPSQ